ncbi:hypothetical protein EK21DRAFT_85121 [Setomelanomma holmii]|uniref:Aminoglycoside phosphotransferase domain-containing protein n=1 Tax=Setomelanomma holmii TaxID=210430 RepID=A0A9P4HJ92_9PLEO|nr:hypothetical protein EK21DRAFT_85121 [Setomelanomma holmii]
MVVSSHKGTGVVTKVDCQVSSCGESDAFAHNRTFHFIRTSSHHTLSLLYHNRTIAALNHNNGHNIAQLGLQWAKDLFNTKPTWTLEPSIETIKVLASKHLGLGQEISQVSFFTQGGFDKMYKIKCDRASFIFRIALPVAPGVKTTSEVATLALVRKNTTIPVPKVIACDADLTNELGIGWILMEHLDGRPLREVWHDMS